MENCNKNIHKSEDEKNIIRKKILEGIDDMKNGRVIDGEKFMRKLKRKYCKR